VIITEHDCGAANGLWIERVDSEGKQLSDEDFRAKVIGRSLAVPVYHPGTGDLIADRGDEISERLELEDGTIRDVIAEITDAGVEKVHVRSVMACEAVHGVCATCYGRNLASGMLVDMGEAVGIIAAQSIGEPGTQLTMRTFHTGGVNRADITTGLPRVEELFEARVPKGAAILAEREGVVSIEQTETGRMLTITSVEQESSTFDLAKGWEPAQPNATVVIKDKTVIAIGPNEEKKLAAIDGTMFIDDRCIMIRNEREEKEEHQVPVVYQVFVEDGDVVTPGQQLTDGAKDPQQILVTLGPDAVQRYIIDEVQKVYKSQGVNTNDKHIEVICRQMLRKVSIVYPGDTDFLQDERVDRFEFNRINEEILAQGGEPATAIPVLLGITKASLETDSFLSAASFQETTRVLTEAAINGKVDALRGLKENVIIGKLIPAGSGYGVTGGLNLSNLDTVTLEAIEEGRAATAVLDVEAASEEDIAELMSTGLLPSDDGVETEDSGYSVADVEDLASGDLS
jgi:DNA-directed RNA polymerase subunit beta'